MSAQPGLADGDLNGPRRRSRRSSSGRDLADQARPASPVSLNGGIPGPFRFGGAIRVDRGQDCPSRKRGPGPCSARAASGSPSAAPRWRCRCRDVVLRHVTDVAAPGCPAHHPGITPRGVICGERDSGSMGRAVRVLAGPRVPARTMIRTADAARGAAPRPSFPTYGWPAPGSSGLSMPRDRQPPAVTGSSGTPGSWEASGTKEGLRADLTGSRDPRVHPALGEARVMPPPSGSEIVPLRASNRWAQVWVMPSGVSVVPRQPAARHMDSPP